jgi:hypothetical protein
VEAEHTVDLTTEEPASPRVPAPARAGIRAEPPRRTIVFDDGDDLDVPDFLK